MNANVNNNINTMYYTLYGIIMSSVTVMLSQSINNILSQFIELIKNIYKYFLDKKYKYTYTLRFNKHFDCINKKNIFYKILQKINEKYCHHGEILVDFNINGQGLIPNSIIKISEKEDIYIKIDHTYEEIMEKGHTEKNDIHIITFYSNTINPYTYVNNMIEEYKIKNLSSRFKRDIYFFIQGDSCKLYGESSFFHYYPYLFKSSKTFDNIFIEDHLKNNLIYNLDKSKETGQKLAILLHGIPGCGKTSIIKAISNYTNRHIFDLKIDNIKKNSDPYLALLDTFNSNIKRNMANVHIDIPLNKCIFVLEEFDRYNDNDNIYDYFIDFMVKDEKINKDELKKYNNQSIIQSLLVLFDGILELKDIIIIMTTNHIEKIDPALLRPGRVDLNIELGPMSCKLANEMIKTKFDVKTPVNIKDNKYTPAQIENLLRNSQSLEEFKTNLKNL